MSRISRFGIFELDFHRNELRRKGVRIKLQQQPFEILRLLVEHRGEPVSRDLIQRTLWPDGHFVDFERSINSAVRRLRQELRERADAPSYIETVARTGYRLIPPVIEHSSGRNEIRAIAVLPLQDLSNTPDTQYFADGLANALITEIAQASNLRVVSCASAVRSKDSQLNVCLTAKELNVQALVTGSILYSGHRIRISVRLLDGAVGRQIWTQTYDRSLKDILLLQKEIAAAIISSASAIVKQDTHPDTRRRINPKAYEFWLRGNFMFSMRSPAQMAKAAEYYENAIHLEPQWAPPYAMLAECCRTRVFYDYPNSKQLVARANAMASQALRLEPNNARANAVAGAVQAIHDWKWIEGEEQVKRALRWDPTCSQIEHDYSQVLLNWGRFEEALRHADAALAMEPTSLVLWSHRAQILLFGRRFDDCLHESEQLLEQFPDFAMGHVNYGAALIEAGRPAEALPHFESTFASTGMVIALFGIMHSHYELGRREEALQGLGRLQQMYRQGVCSPAMLAWGNITVGETEEAFPLLETALAGRDTPLSLFVHLPQFDIVRADDRFMRILQKMNLQ